MSEQSNDATTSPLNDYLINSIKKFNLNNEQIASRLYHYYVGTDQKDSNDQFEERLNAIVKLTDKSGLIEELEKINFFEDIINKYPNAIFDFVDGHRQFFSFQNIIAHFVRSCFITIMQKEPDQDFILDYFPLYKEYLDIPDIQEFYTLDKYGELIYDIDNITAELYPFGPSDTFLNKQKAITLQIKNSSNMINDLANIVCQYL